MQPTNLNLNYIVPTVVADGNGVFINEADVPTIVFFESRRQTEEGMQADVVASIRISSIADLEALKNAISETIDKHASREK